MVKGEKKTMRNGWKWFTLAVASLWLLASAGKSLAAPSVGSTSVRPHRVLQQGATADGSISTWFVFEAVVTPGADNEVILDVFVTFNGVPGLRLSPVGGNLYRAAMKGADIGIGTHNLGVLVLWRTDTPQNPVTAAFSPGTLIVVPQVTGVLSRAQLWRVRTLFEDEVLAATDPLQRDPLRPDPLDLLAPDDGSSSTRYRYRVVYRHPFGIPPQPIYSAFSMNAANGAFTYEFVSDTFMPPPPFTEPPHAIPLWGTGAVGNNDFGGVYIYIDGEPHWMVPVYKFDSGGNPVPLGTLTPQDFQNGVVYEYIWEPTHYASHRGDTRYGLPYKYGRPTDNAFVVGAHGVHGYEFRAGVDHFPTEISEPGVFVPGHPLQDPAYPLLSLEHPRITPVLSGFRSMLEPNFLHLGTVRRADSDSTVFWNPDYQLPNGPFHPQPGPTAPGTQSFPVAMGTEDTVFEFRILYQGDRDPAYIKVFISNDFTGTSYPTQLTMQPLNPAQTNPGIYVARTRLPRGPHTYYFEANDGTRTVRFPVRPLDDPVLPAGGIHTKGRNFFMGPFVNTKAVLSDYSVTPATGKQGTNFVFRVKYTDANNQRPVRARLHLQLRDDPAPVGTWVTVNMVRESPAAAQYSDGVVYRFDTSSDPSIVLQPGTRHYFFEFVDNWGDLFDPNTLLPGETTLLPANATTNPDDPSQIVLQNTIAGPIVVENKPPYLVNPATAVSTDVNWTPDPADAGGDYLASDTFQNTATSFTFRTKYVDKNNDAPTFIKVRYRNTADPGSVFERDLSIAPGSGTLYSDGVVYQVTGIKLPVGQTEFRFTTSDGTVITTTDWQAGPNVVANTAPVLEEPAGGTVTPTSGDQGTLYTFRVLYRDAEGQAPEAANGGFIRVWIDGTEYDMVPSGTPDYERGAVFEYATTLGAEPSVHQYHFVASDGAGTVRLPTTGEFGGPNVNDFNKLSSPRVIITPAGNTEPRGRSDAAYAFQITFTNPAGTPPVGNIEVLVDGTPYVLNEIIPANPTPTDFRNGVTYSLTLNAPAAPMTPGQHRFQFRFQNGAFTTPLQNVAVNHKPVLLDHKVTTDGSTATTQVSKVARPIFLVTYRDADNDAPRFVRLFIDGDPTGVSMTSTGGTNYRAGVVYRYQTPAPLALGSHNYRITAQDAFFQEDAPEVSGTFEVVNFKPVLSEGAVTPATGSHNAAFTYRVKYTDGDGDAPDFVRVRILRPDGTEQQLNLSGSGDYTRGVTFTGTIPANSRLLLGNYQFRFEANDGTVDADPLLGDGPTVTNARPVLSNGSVVPVRESGRAAFQYSVTYTDADGDAPEFVRVVVIQPDNSERTLDMTGSGTDYTGGVIYTAQVPANSNLAPGSYGFRFVARDDYGADADPLTGTGPQVNNPPQLVNPRVTPPSGKLSTEYVFEVTYKDADNDAPRAFTGAPGGEVQVNIDGTWYAMTRAGTGADYRTGVTYQFRRRLSEGTHTFRFRAQDQFDAAVGPGTEVQTGPTVNRATITLTAPSGTAMLGQTITLNGQLTLSGSATVNETVQVVISPPVGAGEVKNVNTASDGSFAVQFTPGTTGAWSAYAAWAGNEQYDGVNSAPVTVQVQGATFTIQRGVSMISIPLIPPSRDPDFLFGFDTRTINLIRWLPQANRYVGAGSVIAEAGAGYWVRVTGSSVNVSPVGTLVDQTQPFSIQLARGWNMIGSVYLQPTLLGAAQVRVAGQLMSLAEAARRGLVRDYAWRYDLGAYDLVSASENLQPFVGYWIRALVDAELILNPPGSRSAGGTSLTRSAKMSEGEWMVQLVARAGNSVDSANYIGVSSDSLQIEKPAPLENYVHLVLHSPDNDAPLAVDVRRSASLRQVYTFEVHTDMPNTPVTLSWPNVAKVSRDLEMVLVDLDANVRRVLTSLPSYTYNSGANGGARRFQIVVQPRVRTAAVISNVRVAQTRAAGSTRVQITYTLSTEASVAVQVTDASGKPIRVLQAGQAAGRGVNNITWDGRNSAGVAVPAGAYLMRVTATTGDGQTASVVQPVVLTR